jgi:hypothetical protein
MRQRCIPVNWRRCQKGIAGPAGPNNRLTVAQIEAVTAGADVRRRIEIKGLLAAANLLPPEVRF